MDRFQSCLAETLRWEGGWSNDPVDPGGATMKGVIQVEYDAYCDRSNQPRHSVRGITTPEVESIYHRNYWLLVRGGELPRGVDLVFFDFAVNSGVGQAVTSMQRVLRMSRDGHLGMQTMAAIHEAAPSQLIRDYMDERRRFLRNLSTFWRFGKGWMSRCDGVETAALAADSGSHPLFHAAIDLAEPLADPDAQSAQIGKAPAQSPAPPAATEATVGVGGMGGLAAAAPGIMERATVGGKLNGWMLLAAIASEPLFWVAATALVGSLMFWLHRRRVALS